MGLFKRGQVWWMDYSFNGERRRRSTFATDKKQAQKILDKIKGEIAQGRWFEKLPGDERTFEEMMERYMREHSNPKKASTARDRASLLHLTPFFTGFTLTQITPKLIGDYKVKRREEGASSSTINREVALLKHAFTLAFKVWEWVADNPVTKVPMEKEPPARDRWLTFEQEEKVLSCSRQWLKGVLIFAIDTGCRRGEILSLEWKDVNLLQKVVVIFGKKTGDRRTIPLTERVRLVLQERERARGNGGGSSEDLVFTYPPGSRINIYTLRWAFEEALEKAGVRDFRFHDLRHTFASRLAQSGVDPYTIQKLMGHTSFVTTQRYAHHFVESLRRGVETLEASRKELKKDVTEMATVN